MSDRGWLSHMSNRLHSFMDKDGDEIKLQSQNCQKDKFRAKTCNKNDRGKDLCHTDAYKRSTSKEVCLVCGIESRKLK